MFRRALNVKQTFSIMPPILTQCPCGNFFYLCVIFLSDLNTWHDDWTFLFFFHHGMMTESLSNCTTGRIFWGASFGPRANPTKPPSRLAICLHKTLHYHQHHSPMLDSTWFHWTLKKIERDCWKILEMGRWRWRFRNKNFNLKIWRLETKKFSMRREDEDEE